MRTKPLREDNPRIQAALKDLESLIREQYPEASFDTFMGEDPEGVYLRATVDVEHTDEVFDVVVDRLLELQVEERLPVYVVTVRPFERVAAELEAEQNRKAHPLVQPTL